MKHLLTLFMLCFCATTVAQTSVTSSGISVQGIARDGDGNPFANVSNLNANISLYYIDNNNVINPVNFTGAQLTTDSNGVFSYVYEVGASYFRSFEKESLYIWMGTGSPSSPQITFLNEKLSAVPYAIYAHNGSPTGIILPFTGKASKVPPGWLLCDGSAIPSSGVYDNLRAVLGVTSVPDLRGVFLRGFGNINSTNLGPAQNAFQNDMLWEHDHNLSITSNTTGNHTHDVYGLQCCHGDDGSTFYPQYDNRNWNGPEGYPSINEFIRPDGYHFHQVTGNTSSIGESETRPTNYGVNYIIKI